MSFKRPFEAIRFALSSQKMARYRGVTVLGTFCLKFAIC